MLAKEKIGVVIERRRLLSSSNTYSGLSKITLIQLNSIFCIFQHKTQNIPSLRTSSVSVLFRTMKASYKLLEFKTDCLLSDNYKHALSRPLSLLVLQLHSLIQHPFHSTLFSPFQVFPHPAHFSLLIPINISSTLIFPVLISFKNFLQHSLSVFPAVLSFRIPHCHQTFLCHYCFSSLRDPHFFPSLLLSSARNYPSVSKHSPPPQHPSQ